MPALRFYLDHNASAPLRPEAKAAMFDCLDLAGNASSVHSEGRKLRGTVEDARLSVAAFVGARALNVIFTSCATEAANQALVTEITGGAPAGHLYVLATEHPCVLNGGRFPTDRVTQIPVRPNGLIDLDALDGLLAAHDCAIGRPYVAVQLANGETGIVQPVTEVARRVSAAGGYTLCDAVQAAGRIPVDIMELGVSFLILSSHKIGGPQGAGALVLADEDVTPKPLLNGGGQEKRQRGGTENVAAIAGFGATADVAAKEINRNRHLGGLRDSIEASLVSICAANDSAPIVFGDGAPRLPNTSNFAVPGISAETALISFDLEGVAISSGSACSSGKVSGSHVLGAMGVDGHLAKCALRVSLGWNSTEEDVAAFARAFEKIAGRLARAA